MGGSDWSGMALAFAPTTVALATTACITAVCVTCYRGKDQRLVGRDWLGDFACVFTAQSSRASTVRPAFYIDDHLEN